MVTLFEKYGGFSAVSKIVMTLYDKILDSDQVGDECENFDVKALIGNKISLCDFETLQ